MTFLVIQPHGVIEAEGELTPEILAHLVEGEPQSLRIPGPGFVRAYSNGTPSPTDKQPNVLATLFYHKHGFMDPESVIRGTVAITGGDGSGGNADAPGWVTEALLALVPRTRAILRKARWKGRRDRLSSWWRHRSGDETTQTKEAA
jgi:hypothetical protein